MLQWYSKFIDKEGNLSAEKIKTLFPYKNLEVELTTFCPCKCIHCPKSLDSYNRKLQQMSLSVFKKSVDQFLTSSEKYNTGSILPGISLSMDGDAVCSDIFIDAIKYIKGKKARITVVTNAVGLEYHISKQLLEIDTPIRMVFDLYGGNADQYSRITQTKFYKKVCDNIAAFMELLEKSGNSNIETRLHSLNKEVQRKDLVKIYRQWDKFDFDSICVTELRPQPKMNLRELGVKKVPVKRSPCILPFAALSVHCNGDVSACHLGCSDKSLIVGNIMNATFEEIWNGDKWNTIRRKLLKGDLQGLLCEKCDTWHFLSGYYDTNIHGYLLKEMNNHLKSLFVYRQRIFGQMLKKYLKSLPWQNRFYKGG